MTDPACEVQHGVQLLETPAWNELLARSGSTNSVFLASEFLLAASEGYGDAPFTVSVRESGRLVGAAAFVTRRAPWDPRQRVEFLGRGASDYLDVIVDASLPAGRREGIVRQIVSAALEQGATSAVLSSVPVESGTLSALSGAAGLHVTALKTTPAPTMDMSAAPAAARKKSLKRHTNKLAKAGALEFATHSTTDDILPALEAFFDLHVRRWADTPTPSFFEQPLHRVFYRSLVTRLAPTGAVRYVEVTLDGRLLAAHLGFVHGGRYTWYKPAFEPEFDRYSPGEVLLKHLIEQAMAEQENGVSEFDFTVGDEAFKLRFATRVRAIADVHVTASPVRAQAQRGYVAAREGLKAWVEPETWARLRSNLGVG